MSHQIQEIVLGILTLILSVPVLYYLWIYPIVRGVKTARVKALSPHWMWFGIHPVGGWIAYLILHVATPRKACPGCAERLKSHAQMCPYCGYKFDVSTSSQTKTPPPPPIVEKQYPALSTESSERPRSVVTSVALLIAVLVIGLVGSVLQLPKLRENPQLRALPEEFVVAIAITTTLVIIILITSLAYKIYQRRNWARITLLVLFILGIPFSVQALAQSLAQDPLLGLLRLGQVVLQICAISLLFVKPSRDWFAPQGTQVPSRD